MRPLIPRVAAIHDLSGFGRSSLCNVLPILSTMGIQACPVPTAVLSTHSGGFDGYTFRDLTEDIPGFIRHWKELGLEFDGIYSGFLGSPRQVELVRELIHTFRTPKTWVVIDPVMGDGGSLYSSISKDMIGEMRRLIGEADLIVPTRLRRLSCWARTRHPMRIPLRTSNGGSGRWLTWAPRRCCSPAPRTAPVPGRSVWLPMRSRADGTGGYSRPGSRGAIPAPATSLPA